MTRGKNSAPLIHVKPDKQKIEGLFKQIMTELGLDLKDPSLSGTPKRVSKMYVEEIFGSLYNKAPEITTFPNDGNYDQMLVEKDITLYSVCEHHFVPIVGKCHVAYIPGDRLIGLSKLIRIVQYYAAKPQVQERLTQTIGESLKNVLNVEDVAVVIDAKHYCCSMRGAKDPNSSTITSYVSGRFREEPSIKGEFLNFISK